LEHNPASKVSITLQNNMGEYLSTIVQNLTDFSVRDNVVYINLKLASKVIAPNSYAFRVAVFVPNGKVYDLVEMVCPVKIFDSGTEMALFEGFNYGSFFINYQVLNNEF
jgi:lipopolysaccharide transport system ATP-binding protein